MKQLDLKHMKNYFTSITLCKTRHVLDLLILYNVSDSIHTEYLWELTNLPETFNFISEFSNKEIE